jgi:DNA-binding CsgD family transcriptional regulator
VSANCDPWERGSIAVWLLRTESKRTLHGEVAEPYRRQLDGDWARAAQLWTNLGCPYDAAMTLLDAKQEEPSRQALSIFQEHGASASVQVTRQQLRRLGVRSIPSGARAATRAHPLGLTRREGEVLALICNGRTNAEIAAKLFISAKTVDHHVSAILAKMDAPSRNVAASEAVRLGLVGAAEI